MDKVLQATAMITALLFHLGVLHSPHKVHHEFPGNHIDTVRVFTFHFLILFSTFLFQLCQVCMVGILGTGWFHLSFCKGKKLVVLGLAVLSITWFCGLQESSMESSFSASLAAQR